jgi:hypothetical protein
MKKYANSPDPAVRELVKQVGLGDSQANLKLQQHIADDFFGKRETPTPLLLFNHHSCRRAYISEPSLVHLNTIERLYPLAPGSVIETLTEINPAPPLITVPCCVYDLVQRWTWAPLG